jgi:hypothetical protein
MYAGEQDEKKNTLYKIHSSSVHVAIFGQTYFSQSSTQRNEEKKKKKKLKE